MPGAMLTDIVTKNLTTEELKRTQFIDDNGNVCSHVKTLEQGAATSVYAAVASELEDKGGIYLENCSISEIVMPVPNQLSFKGYAAYSVDPINAQK
jgi:hypothetical protein